MSYNKAFKLNPLILAFSDEQRKKVENELMVEASKKLSTSVRKC